MPNLCLIEPAIVYIESMYRAITVAFLYRECPTVTCTCKYIIFIMKVFYVAVLLCWLLCCYYFLSLLEAKSC